MESIKGQIDKWVERATPQTTARNFREELINEFVSRLNIEREGTSYGKVLPHVIAIKLNSNPFLKQNWQLEAFLKQCKAARNFSKCFWGSLSTKNK